MNNVREGLIPAVLGTAVTAAGYALSQSNRVNNRLSNTVVGFGLAHIVLGAIDLFEHRQ
ncbi:asparagine synthase [Bacillus massilinigeriensis]|uniref:asparagine synthase n=1 Tax=Bacillus mediterraneensis TaxID=1805474 RepID=UPI0008F93257|nr:asparagine synthase [Bacillus mediterraneensis]